MEPQDRIISCNDINLSTKVPISKALEVIETQVPADGSLREQTLTLYAFARSDRSERRQRASFHSNHANLQFVAVGVALHVNKAHTKAVKVVSHAELNSTYVA